MATSGLPTTYRGHVQEAWYAALGDWQEYIGDLIWPLSVTTYGQMRKDPQLAAVLSAYMLPIRRATWTIDPSGCRPEVVQLVADDLGLPVAGADTPGPGRARGVSWAEHLRVALLHLVWGHYGFEILAEVDDSGRARLAGLSDRMPATITNIHASDQGDLLGISQDNRLYEAAPQIGADRLVWYCHDREGALWQGNSLLRPAFAPWLLKRECQKILATSSRRFGMGVPTVRALPGTLPTTEQMHAAAAVAQQMRVGEEAGASIPPGFVVELLGMQGGTPDTLAFLQWLDRQSSRMALVGFLDLGGDAQNGSYALSAQMIDLFTLALQGIADYIADVATRQIAARLTAWNWENEPVPAVRVADVGSRHEVTAEAIQQLMASGAVAPDPALESWARRTFRMPQRATPPAPAPPGPETQPVAARTRRKRTSPSQLELPIAAAVAGDDDPLAAAVSEMQADWPGIAEPMVADLADQAGQVAESGNLAVLGSLTVSAVVAAGIAAALTAAMSGLAATVAATLVTGQRKAPADAGADRIGQVAQATAGILANVYASSAARTAMQQPGATAATVAAAVRAGLEALSTAQAGMVAEHLAAALHMSEGAALIAVCEKYPPKTVTADEHRDSPNCCEVCRAADGEVFSSLADALMIYPNGAQNAGCLGGPRCRGRLLPGWS